MLYSIMSRLHDRSRAHGRSTSRRLLPNTGVANRHRLNCPTSGVRVSIAKCWTAPDRLPLRNHQRAHGHPSIPTHGLPAPWRCKAGSETYRNNMEAAPQRKELGAPMDRAYTHELPSWNIASDRTNIPKHAVDHSSSHGVCVSPFMDLPGLWFDAQLRSTRKCLATTSSGCAQRGEVFH